LSILCLGFVLAFYLESLPRTPDSFSCFSSDRTFPSAANQK